MKPGQLLSGIFVRLDVKKVTAHVKYIFNYLKLYFMYGKINFYHLNNTA